VTEVNAKLTYKSLTDRLPADEPSVAVVVVTFSQCLIEYEQVKVNSIV